MKKFGFTLAEILITLGIIGVVAALTTPALVKNTGHAKVGPALSKFVNTFETGAEEMLASGDVEDFSNVNYAMNSMAKHIVMTPYTNEYKLQNGDSSITREVHTEAEAQAAYDAFTLENGRALANCNNHPLSLPCRDLNLELSRLEHNISATSGVSRWQLKDGSIMAVIPRKNPVELNGTKGAYKGIVAEILYDIDGDKAVNKAGKDVFAFLLDKSGVLIPSGSSAHKHIADGTTNQVGNYYATSASEVCSTTSSNLSANLNCTGKIADNNWKYE